MDAGRRTAAGWRRGGRHADEEEHKRARGGGRQARTASGPAPPRALAGAGIRATDENGRSMQANSCSARANARSTRAAKHLRGRFFAFRGSNRLFSES